VVPDGTLYRALETCTDLISTKALSAKHMVFFCSASQTPHEVTNDFLCLYSPKSNLVEKVRNKGTINSAGRLWQIVLELADQHT